MKRGLILAKIKFFSNDIFYLPLRKFCYRGGSKIKDFSFIPVLRDIDRDERRLKKV